MSYPDNSRKEPDLMRGYEDEATDESTLSPLESYTAAMDALQQFERENLYLFSRRDALARAVGDAEAALKVYAREVGNLENERFVVTVQHKTGRTWDTAKLLAEAPYLRQLPGLVTEIVNTKEVERIAKGNQVLADAIVSSGCITETPLTPAVSIKAR